MADMVGQLRSIAGELVALTARIGQGVAAGRAGETSLNAVGRLF